MTTANMPFVDVPLAGAAEAAPTVALPTAPVRRVPRYRTALATAERGLSTVFGDLRGAWLWRVGPPPLREVVRVRKADWPVFEQMQHQCVERQGQTEYNVHGGWVCACHPVTDGDRARNTRQIRIYKVWRGSWVAYNHLVAIPVTAVAYVLAWVLQHPARALLAGITAGVIWVAAG